MGDSSPLSKVSLVTIINFNISGLEGVQMLFVVMVEVKVGEGVFLKLCSDFEARGGGGGSQVRGSVIFSLS